MSSTPIRDVLLPDSDRTALIQVLVVIALTATATFLLRRERALVLFTVGLGMTLVGVLALRTLH